MPLLREAWGPMGWATGTQLKPTAKADRPGWPGHTTHLPPSDVQVLLQEVHGVCSGHIARGLVVLACQDQNEPEAQAAAPAPTPGPAASAAPEPSPSALPACSPGLWNFSASPRSCSIRDRVWPAASPAETRNTYPLDTAAMSSTGGTVSITHTLQPEQSLRPLFP